MRRGGGRVGRDTRSVLAELAGRIGRYKDAENLLRRAVELSPGFTAARANLAIRDFLFQRMYRHWRVNRTMAKSKRVVQVLFSLLHGGPAMLPPLWRARAGEAGSAKAALVVCDYIAGMTDRFALEEHRRMTDPDISG